VTLTASARVSTPFSIDSLAFVSYLISFAILTLLLQFFLKWA
jgi:hypothetical protein